MEIGNAENLDLGLGEESSFGGGGALRYLRGCLRFGKQFMNEYRMCECRCLFVSDYYVHRPLKIIYMRPKQSWVLFCLSSLTFLQLSLPFTSLSSPLASLSSSNLHGLRSVDWGALLYVEERIPSTNSPSSLSFFLWSSPLLPYCSDACLSRHQWRWEGAPATWSWGVLVAPLHL